MKAGETANLIFFAFDLLFLGDQDFRSLPLMERKKRLQGLLAENEGQKMVQFASTWMLPAATGIVSKRLAERTTLTLVL